jgi:hypothetical protein
MSGPEDEVSQAEKRAVLHNDAVVRANANRNGETDTYLSHTHIDDAGGRFARKSIPQRLLVVNPW